MKIVQYHPFPEGRRLDSVARSFPCVEYSYSADIDDLRSHLVGAEVLVIGNRAYERRAADVIKALGSSLRWVQFTSSGIDNVMKYPLPSGLVVTNAAGFRAFCVAEHAIALMLGLARGFHLAAAAQREAVWRRQEISPKLFNLVEANLTIIGTGAVAQELARRAKAFGMQTTAVTRTPRELPDFDKVLPREALKAALSEADVVAVCASYSEDTHEIINAEAVAAMKNSSILINVARGSLVDEAALLSALQEGRIRGAGLDVFVTEPLPADHPFFRQENLIVTPHVAGAGSPAPGGGINQIFSDNLRRWIDGRSLEKVVIPRTA